MIIGCEDVGKTTFKRKLDNLNGNNELINIQNNRNEEDMTHGVDIKSIKSKDGKSLFSVWDFAGKQFDLFYYFYQ